MLYKIPTFTHYMDPMIYEGSDSITRNVWHEDRNYKPIFGNTDCIMDAWHSKVWKGNMNC